jgi:paraquat-inducible protein A
MRPFYYLISIALAVVVLSASLEEMRLTRIVSAKLDIDHSTDLAWKSLWETLTFSWYSGATQARSEISQLLAEAKHHNELSTRAAAAFLAVTVVFLGTRVWQARGRRDDSRISLTADVIGVSALCLVVGLVAPVFSLKAFAQLPVLGEIVLKYEAKSILMTVASLVKSQTYFVAFLVSIFSIVIPALKIFISTLVIQHRSVTLQGRGIAFIKSVGKWSMADVFVVAILVAYFAVSGDEFSEAKVEVGLYFFATYCLASLLSTHLLVRSLDAAR